MAKSVTARRHQQRKRARGYRKDLIRKYGKTCYHCGIKLIQHGRSDNPRRLTIEHVVQLSRGGTSAFGNLRLACYACNQRGSNNGDLCAGQDDANGREG
jgi:5-methylcytosine-specific restriction endonuclease McrA